MTITVKAELDTTGENVIVSIIKEKHLMMTGKHEQVCHNFIGVNVKYVINKYKFICLENNLAHAGTENIIWDISGSIG